MDKLLRHRLGNAYDVVKLALQQATFVNDRMKRPGPISKRTYGPILDDAVSYLERAERVVNAILNSRPELHLTHDEIRQRWPRLIQAMIWAACLSESEAVTCLQDYLLGYPWSGEAVNHYGGTKEVIQRASKARVRHLIATVRRTDPQVLEI